jgi:hypothetical protein
MQWRKSSFSVISENPQLLIWLTYRRKLKIFQLFSSRGVLLLADRKCTRIFFGCCRDTAVSSRRCIFTAVTVVYLFSMLFHVYFYFLIWSIFGLWDCCVYCCPATELMLNLCDVALLSMFVVDIVSMCSLPLSTSDMFKMGIRVTGRTGQNKLKVCIDKSLLNTCCVR